MSPIVSRAVKLITGLSVLVTTPGPGAVARPTTPATPDWNLTTLRRLNPMLDEFARENFAPDLDGRWHARELDEDPWFLRAQSWVAPIGDGLDERTAFVTEHRALRVQVAGTDRALEIARPLAPAFELENFLFLRATDPALFGDAGAGDGGLFFIDKKLIYDELGRPGGPRPLPVFFLPLAGEWTGRVEHVFDESTGTLALNDGRGHSATLGLDTLRGLARQLALNVTLAIVSALKHDPAAWEQTRRDASRGRVELPFAYPARGATFAFGTVFTGVDLDSPERGLVRARAEVSWRDLVWPQAFAALPPDVFESLIKTAMLFGSVYVLSTFAQITVLKDRLVERRRGKLQREGLPPPRTRGERLKAGAVDNLDVFSNALPVLGNGFQIGGGYVLEYFADRSGVRAAQSGWIRKLIEKTFLYGRKQAERIATTARAAFLGMGVTGGMDIGTVAFGLFYLSAIVMPPVAGFFGPELRARVTEQFSGHDQAGNNLIWGEVMFNVQGLPQHAWIYPYTQRRAFIEVVKPEVQRSFVQRGLNPLDARNADAVDDEIERRVEPMMVERKLPSNDEFLFSSPSIVRAFAAFLGYEVPAADVLRSDSYDPENPPRFLLAEARWGLTRHALKKALARNLEMQQVFPDDLNIREAGEILNEMNRRLFTLSAMARDPRHAGRAWREGKQVRRILTFLSLRDDVASSALPFIDLWKPESPEPLERLIAIEDDVLRIAAWTRGAPGRRELRKLVRERVRRNDPDLLPALEHADWRGVSLRDRLAEVRAEAAGGLLGAAVRNERAAALAGRTVRQELNALVSGQDDRPKFGDVAVFIDDARREAFARLKAAPPRVGFSDADITIEALEIVKDKVAARTKREAERAWTPKRGDWLERHQLARAHAAAERAIGYDLGTDDPVKQAAYKEAFRVKLARVVGLRTYETPLLEDEYLVTRTARESAEHEVNDGLANNPNWRAFVARCSPGERLRFVAHQYADAFLSKYTELTVSKSSLIPLTSPGQPGFFQAARQTEFARRKNWLGRATTYALRVGDSFFDATAHRPGIMAWVKRRVPLAQDVLADSELRLRGLIPFLTISWAVNYYLWGVHFNLPTVLWFFVTGGLTDVAHWWVDRVLMNVGVPPLGGILSQLKYATLLTSVTYFTMMPFFFFNQDFEKMFNAARAACVGWLTGRRATR